MNIYQPELTPKILEKLTFMSADWASDGSTHGYYRNSIQDFSADCILIAEENGSILGYLLANYYCAKQNTSVMEKDTPCLEIEELYIIPEMRSRGIGSALFHHAQKIAQDKDVSYITLSTSAKDYQRILHFYVDELGMDFWSARLFKRI